MPHDPGALSSSSALAKSGAHHILCMCTECQLFHVFRLSPCQVMHRMGSEQPRVQLWTPSLSGITQGFPNFSLLHSTTIFGLTYMSPVLLFT